MPVEIRPLSPDDVESASLMAHLSLREMSIAVHHEDVPLERSPQAQQMMDARVAHIQRHDPRGSWAAWLDGELVGVALATRREDLWFLSLLAVKTDVQGQQIGKQLLDAALGYADGCTGAWIMSSLDPRAMRRYERAGFAMHPTYEVSGIRPDLTDADTGIRAGDLLESRELIDEVTRGRRGAAMGPDVDFWHSLDARLLVLDTPTARGYAIVTAAHAIRGIAATDDEAASRLLRAAILSLPEGHKAELGPFTGGQQWAIRTAHDLGLGLKPGASLCFRGEIGPELGAYMPNGAFG